MVFRPPSFILTSQNLCLLHWCTYVLAAHLPRVSQIYLSQYIFPSHTTLFCNIDNRAFSKRGGWLTLYFRVNSERTTFHKITGHGVKNVPSSLSSPSRSTTRWLNWSQVRSQARLVVPADLDRTRGRGEQLSDAAKSFAMRWWRASPHYDDGEQLGDAMMANNSAMRCDEQLGNAMSRAAWRARGEQLGNAMREKSCARWQVCKKIWERGLCVSPARSNCKLRGE